MSTNQPETIHCCSCDVAFQWARPDRYYQRRLYCGTCSAAVIERNYQQALEKVDAAILAQIPSRFRQTDLGHPDFNRPLWQRIEAINLTDVIPWLGMTGPTGEGKTRCAFLKLAAVVRSMIRPTNDPERRPWIPSFEIVSAYRFGEIVAGQFVDETNLEAVNRLRALRKSDVLFIDDLGKQRNTPAVAAELFALLDHRHAGNLRTIWTSNSSPEGIVTGMPEHLAAPLAGKIRECSTIINLE